MPDTTLSENEKKVLSYISRGVSKDTAVHKINDFFSMPANDVLGAISTLKAKGLVIESRSVGNNVVVYTTNPLKVRSSMLDQSIIQKLSERERGVKAGALKKTVFNPNTGEIREVDRRSRQENTKHQPDLGFDIE